MQCRAPSILYALEAGKDVFEVFNMGSPDVFILKRAGPGTLGISANMRPISHLLGGPLLFSTSLVCNQRQHD